MDIPMGYLSGMVCAFRLCSLHLSPQTINFFCQLQGLAQQLVRRITDSFLWIKFYVLWLLVSETNAVPYFSGGPLLELHGIRSAGWGGDEISAPVSRKLRPVVYRGEFRCGIQPLTSAAIQASSL
ncbi:hypothetical protein AVEN_23727-1 [Araneus ventricosus]|uniref:Uncharacterized protein n=1 Tax=Araneus ventricosus TaxID=182803 RepID=A0A4Y2S7T1_ARAVE|nr:hypothetical protein AVEN_23727-1 [Araneus ventricosus]